MLEHKFTSVAYLFHGMWDFPRPGIEPTSLALAGGFFTTEPPGKPVVKCFNEDFVLLIFFFYCIVDLKLSGWFFFHVIVLSCMHACMLSRFSHVQLCATLWTAAHQAVHGIL